MLLWPMVSSGLAEEKVINIGVPLALSGAKSKFGEMHHKSYLMALDEINTSGGIRKGEYVGHRLEFLFEDTRGKAETGKELSEKLISQDKVPIIMGGYSSAVAFSIAEVCEQNKIPYISPSGAADKITQQGWEYTFRLNPPASEYASGLEDFLDKVDKPESMVILFENTRFGTSTAEAMRRWCEENAVGVLMFEPYEPWATDFKGVLTIVNAVNADALYIAAHLMEAIVLVRQLAELNVQPKVLAGSVGAFSVPEFIESVGALSENILSAAVWTPNVKYPGALEYVGKHKAKYGAVPDYHGAEAYAAATVCRDVLERTKSLEANDIVEALRATDMMTAFGPVKFTSYDNYTNQNRLITLVLQIQEGKFQPIWPPEAATATFVYPTQRQFKSQESPPDIP